MSRKFVVSLPAIWMPIILPQFNEFNSTSSGARAIQEIFTQSIMVIHAYDEEHALAMLEPRIDMNSGVCLPIINMTGPLRIT